MTVEALAKMMDGAKCDCGKRMTRCEGCAKPLCWACDDVMGDAEHRLCFDCDNAKPHPLARPASLPFVPGVL